MLFIYRVLINFVLIFSPFIIVYRLLNNKEDYSRVKEKLGFINKLRNNGKLIWFHGSSVGEVLSIFPLLEKLEKNKKISQILITTNTLSSASILKKINFKKTIHQYFPIDSNIVVKKFLNHWKPDCVYLIESEIWPNSILEIKERNIPLILLNARITKKTYLKWKGMPNFSRNLFEKFDLCLCQNSETSFYLKKLGSKTIKNLGNLKFSENKFFSNRFINSKKVNLIGKTPILGSISTHKDEELFCAKVHLKLKKKYPKLLTVIIPRHIDRVEEITNKLLKLNLKIHLHNSKKRMQKNTDIYIVNTFGEISLFLKNFKVVFVGGSIIKHGGQNPLEAARYGCKIIHGPFIKNFSEVYQLLKEFKISKKIRNEKQFFSEVKKIFKNKFNQNQNIKKLKFLGHKVLKNNYDEILKFIK